MIFLLLFCPFCFSQTDYVYSQPKELEDGWKTKHLNSLSIDTTLVHQMFNQIVQGENKLHSVLLIQKGELLIEEYFNGQLAGQLHDLRSVTKSIRSLLVGIALDKGYIENIDDSIFKYLKEQVPQKNLGNGKEDITIKHLLTMSSGMDCNDWDKKSKGQEDRVYKKKDWVQHTLDLPMINTPGTTSHYCSMGVLLLAEIIRQTSQMTIQEFAQLHLFNPLGITNVEWGHTSNGEVISSGKRLYMTPRDMAKIGQLVLQGGKWNEEQVISEAWIMESIEKHTKITGIDYGYLWWNLPFQVDQKTVRSTAATGNGGQYIIIIPEMEILAVFTGGAYNSQEDKLPFAIMNDVFLPTFLKQSNRN